MSYELFGYWRSTASWRIRLVMELKGLSYITRPVHLTKDGGEQHQDSYRKINPQGLVPALKHGDWIISQSTAICEYLESQHPQPALIPTDPQRAAEIRSTCALIACDTHPLNNLAVLQFLEHDLKLDTDQRYDWYAHWIERCFTALETTLASGQGAYCYGDDISLADCFLIPQMFNARRFDCPLEAYPRLLEIEAQCQQNPAFIRAHPDQQSDNPDFVK